MYTIRYERESGRVTMMSAIDPPRDGDLAVESLPVEPAAERGYTHELRVVDGALIWVRVAIEEPAEQEPAPPAPSVHTHDEAEQARAAAYRERVDPITCEIARLRDMGGTAVEISEAEARREAAVAAVKAQWPYPEGAE